MADDRLTARFASGLELDLGEEPKKRIKELLTEISKLSNVGKLFLYLKLPGETSIFKPQQKRDVKAETISIQWIKTHLEPDPNFSLLKKNVYENYKSFCISNNYPCVSLSDFGKNLRSTMKTVHHRRLGRRGEALYAYAGVNYREESKSFVLPDLSKCHKNGKYPDFCCFDGDNHDSDGEDAEIGDDDGNDDDDDDEACDRWVGSVQTSVRNLILEWAEKVVDKNIKFKNYRQLAEHLFTQNFINTNSKDAFVLLSDMRLSGTNKIILPKISTSNTSLNFSAIKAEECGAVTMQNQTKQKLFNTLTKRDELRQQKKRAKQEECEQKSELNAFQISRTCNGLTKSSKVRSSSVEINAVNSQKVTKLATTRPCNVTAKMYPTNGAVKRPASAHQKIILPKIAKTQDSGSFKQGTGLDIPCSPSVNQVLFLAPGAANQLQSTIAPVVITLVPNQTALAKSQTIPAQIHHQVQPSQPHDRDVNSSHDISRSGEVRPLNIIKSTKECTSSNQVTQVVKKLPSSQHRNRELPESSAIIFKTDQTFCSPNNVLIENQISTVASDNLPAPDVLEKVYRDSQFIESLLSNAASNPFAYVPNQLCSRPSFNKPSISNESNILLGTATSTSVSRTIRHKTVNPIRNKFSNQTVSMLLNRQRSSGEGSGNSISQLKLVSDKRPVSKILQDKREKGNFASILSCLPQNASQMIQLPYITRLQDGNNLKHISTNGSQVNADNHSIPGGLILSFPSNRTERVRIHQLSNDDASVCYIPGISSGNTININQSDNPECTESVDFRIGEMVNISRSGSNDSKMLSSNKSDLTTVSVSKETVSVATSNTPSSSIAKSEKATISQLFQLLNEPIVHPDGSVVFQKDSNPSEILSWFESQGNQSISDRRTFYTQNSSAENHANKTGKLIFKISTSTFPNNTRGHSGEDLVSCSPSSFLNDKGSDDVFMPYNNNFAQNLTLQQLSEVLKSKSDKSGSKSSFQKLQPPHLSPSLSKHQESRPVSTSVINGVFSNYEESSRPGCFSHPSTVASAIVFDDMDKAFDDGSKMKKDGSVCFAPVQMTEKITPGISGVKHPQPLVATASTNSKLGNNSLEVSKLRDLHWTGLEASVQANKRSNVGSFVPYNSSNGNVLFDAQALHKGQKEMDVIMSDESLSMFFSNERQRHNSAHEISSGSCNDPWMPNGLLQKEAATKTEAEVDAIFQQGLIDSSSSTSVGPNLSRCHSEPAKCHFPLLCTLDSDILMDNDGNVDMRDGDGKMDVLQNKDENLGDMSVFFEDEDGVVGFSAESYFWNGSSGIRDHLISGMSSPKIGIQKQHREPTSFVTSDKELEFLIDDENGQKPDGVDDRM